MNIILHIGAGKTGTTSIQSVLEKNTETLQEVGVKYLGLMLENCYKKKYKWQNKHQDFHETMMHNDAINDQLLELLLETSEFAKKEDIHTLIWSNESILNRPNHVMHIMGKLKTIGFEIQIIMYVRDYARWQKSAYLQWGLKHKTYKGKLKNFHDWSKTVKPDFYNKLEQILKYGFPVTIRNMENTNDVVSDFLKACNIKIKYKDIVRSIKGNVALSNEELFLRAIFNSKFNEVVHPQKFDGIILKHTDILSSPKKYLQNILPTNNDLINIYNNSEEDMNKINSILASQGQKELGISEMKEKELQINTDIIVKSLADLAIVNAIKIDELTKKINTFEAKKI